MGTPVHFQSSPVQSTPVQVLMRAVRWCFSLSLLNDRYVLISNEKLQTKFETRMANMNSCSTHLSNIICLVALATEPAENQNEYTESCCHQASTRGPGYGQTHGMSLYKNDALIISEQLHCKHSSGRHN